MDIEKEYTAYRQNNIPQDKVIQGLFAKEWIIQQVIVRNLPSERSTTAIAAISSSFGLSTSEAASVLFTTISQCEKISDSIQYYHLEADLRYKNQPSSFFDRIIEEALKNLRKGIDVEDVRELLSPEYLFLDGGPVVLTTREINQAMTAALNTFYKESKQ